jgi:hypothetical protein
MLAAKLEIICKSTFLKDIEGNKLIFDKNNHLAVKLTLGSSITASLLHVASHVKFATESAPATFALVRLTN